MGLIASGKINAGFAAVDITPKLEPDALDKIVDKAVEMLREMFES